MKDAVRQSAHRFSDSNATTASTPSRQAADRIFADISCGELVKEQDPVSIPAGATVQEAFEILTSHGIHFAPVRAEGEEDSYTGVFTFRSICTFLLTQYPQHSRRGFRSDIRIANNTSSKAPIYFDLRRLVCNTVGQRMAASDFAYVSNFVSTAAEDPVRLAFEHFSEGWHRISILDENGKLFGVLSQSAVLRHYVKNIGKENLDSVFPESIEDLFPRCCRTSIFSVQEQDTVMFALSVLQKRKVSSIAVLESSGTLIHSICLSDVQEIVKTKQNQLLFCSVHQYIAHVRQKSMVDDSLLTGRATCTVSHAIQKMTASGQHRVWIVDANRKPCGVLAISDVVLYLLDRQ